MNPTKDIDYSTLGTFDLKELLDQLCEAEIVTNWSGEALDLDQEIEAVLAELQTR